MFTALTSCGPLARPPWSATATMRGRSRTSDQAHMAASGTRRAVTCYSDLLTDNDPNPPPIPLKQIRRAGVNKKWTVSNFVAIRTTLGLCYPFCIFPFEGSWNGVL
jgi:hypothetical protein